VPGQPNRTTLYYYFATPRPGTPEGVPYGSRDGDGGLVFTPPRGARDPFVFFVDDRHLDDLDRHGDTLDAFDFMRALRDERVDEPRLGRMVRDLSTEDDKVPPDLLPRVAVTRNPDGVSARFDDGSTFRVPREWSGKITDVSVSEGIASRLLYLRRRTKSLAAPAAAFDPCRTLGRVRVNTPFYLNEPHMMRRYTALAWDNIRRAPVAFAAASAYRAVRMFVVQGTPDSRTAWQFTGSRIVYPLATLASLSYLALAVAGIVVALRRGLRVWLLLTPVLYIPATICFVLTNMRYTITAQPLMIAFLSVALMAAARAADPADTPAASQPS